MTSSCNMVCVSTATASPPSRDYNSSVEQALRRCATTRVPNRLYLSPRIGFSWTYGTAAQIAAFQGAVRGPRAVVRGGIGMFQSTPTAQSIGSALDNTGLPTAVQQIAVRRHRRADARLGGVRGERVVDPDAVRRRHDGHGVRERGAQRHALRRRTTRRRARSARTCSGAASILDNRLSATVDATYSRNMNQASTFDLNFNPAQQFSLEQRGRPAGLRSPDEHRADDRRRSRRAKRASRRHSRA